MRYEIHSHRFGRKIADEGEFSEDWNEIISVLNSITDHDIKEMHKSHSSKNKSISKSINKLIHKRLIKYKWSPESAIFNDPDYQKGTRWRLDFAKNNISIEVAFNHGEAIAWNLLKPVLASELNHVKKEIQTKLGVIIMATEDMKKNGGFDGAVGTYEMAIRYLKPLQNQLSVPMILIGLKSPESFRVEHIGSPKIANFVDLK